MAGNPSISIYVNEIETRIIFKIKTEYYFELLTPETMKLLGSTNNKIAKDENGENMLHLESTEIVLLQCNIVINDHNHHSSSFSINRFGQLLDISSDSFIFLKTFNSEF